MIMRMVRFLYSGIGNKLGQGFGGLRREGEERVLLHLHDDLFFMRMNNFFKISTMMMSFRFF